jgi:hypothetical protein
MHTRLTIPALLVTLLAPATTAFAQLPAPTLVSPRGVVEGTSHRFSWRALPGAQWYQLYLTDKAAQPKIVEWYTATQAHCAEGVGMCSVELAADFADGYAAWWVRGYNASGGNGAWSAEATLYMRRTPNSWATYLPAAVRFQAVSTNAILDRETGLTWHRAPVTAPEPLASAHFTCNALNVEGKRGWRLPTHSELASLAADGTAPHLPQGHPFTIGATPRFWTTSTAGPTPYHLVGWFDFANNFLTTEQGQSDLYRAWCVRGAASH